MNFFNKIMMTEQNLELGVVVMLKTGGPQMTVVEIEDNMVKCNWFDTEFQLLFSTFPKQALKTV
jgi:uncharacterized protein YodC (DUF2158 family)